MSKSNSSNTSDILDYWDIFQQLSDSYLLFEANDPIYTIVELNSVREKTTGITRDQAIGKPLFDVYPDRSEEFKRTGVNPVHERLRQLLKTGQSQTLELLRYDMENSHGVVEERYWLPAYIPVRNKQGAITHILAATKDMTAEQSAERRMRDAEDRLEAALAIGRVGSWVWRIKDDLVIADTNLARMFGISEQQGAAGLPIRSFVGAIHESDRERVERSIRSSMRKATPFEEEYRTVATDGTMRWVLARGQVDERNKDLFTGVVVDITERRDLQAQIELAHKQDILNRQAAKLLHERNEELEAISRTKDEFVALASHQLRTPATAVKQYLGMVLQGYVGEISELQTEMLGKAFESNERQIQIINQILNAARVDTGRLVMTPVSLDLRNLAQGVADEMRSMFEQRKQRFTLDLPNTPLEVMGDLGYLRMAIENLLHNASIYTPEGGSIWLIVSRHGQTCQLRVTDTGVGIKKSDMSKLFSKFSRIHNPLSVQAGGSGIGLYLAAEIVRLHGGKVTVESAIRRGTTFAISLPLVQNKIRAKQKS